jgi:hypothetical protein
MLATFATLKATRSHCSPTIRANPDETDNAGYLGDVLAIESFGGTAEPAIDGGCPNFGFPPFCDLRFDISEQA